MEEVMRSQIASFLVKVKVQTKTGSIKVDEMRRTAAAALERGQIMYKSFANTTMTSGESLVYVPSVVGLRDQSTIPGEDDPHVMVRTGLALYGNLIG